MSYDNISLKMKDSRKKSWKNREKWPFFDVFELDYICLLSRGSWVRVPPGAPILSSKSPFFILREMWWFFIFRDTRSRLWRQARMPWRLDTADGAVEGKKRSRSQRHHRNHDQTASGHVVQARLQGFEAYRPVRDLGEIKGWLQSIASSFFEADYILSLDRSDVSIFFTVFFHCFFKMF